MELLHISKSKEDLKKLVHRFLQFDFSFTKEPNKTLLTDVLKMENGWVYAESMLDMVENSYEKAKKDARNPEDWKLADKYTKMLVEGLKEIKKGTYHKKSSILEVKTTMYKDFRSVITGFENATDADFRVSAWGSKIYLEKKYVRFYVFDSMSSPEGIVALNILQNNFQERADKEVPAFLKKFKVNAKLKWSPAQVMNDGKGGLIAYRLVYLEFKDEATASSAFNFLKYDGTPPLASL